jgi:hypothetical protein
MSNNRYYGFWFLVGRGGDACVEWPGPRDRGGYGQTHAGRAHRVAWQLANGPVPIGLEVCHACHNPACCNPAHLFLGTHVQNMASSVAAGRIKPNASTFVAGEHHRNAAVSQDDVDAIRTTPYRRGSKVDRGSDFELAERFGLTRQQVGRIRRGQRW